MPLNDRTAHLTGSQARPVRLCGSTSDSALRDRFGVDRGCEPDAALVQHIDATVQAVVLDKGEPSDEPVALGSMQLARIDLWEVGDCYTDALDCHSSEWAAYIGVVAMFGPDLPRFLLIVDRVDIDAWARGHHPFPSGLAASAVRGIGRCEAPRRCDRCAA